MKNRDRMKRAIENKPKPSAAARAKGPAYTPPVDPASYQAEVGKKPPASQRTAKARDARASARGRLPVGSQARFYWKEKRVTGELHIQAPDGKPKVLFHEADGLFQCAEELDLLYRKWLKENQPQVDKEAK